MKWLLNSAVLPAGEYGTYEFSAATQNDLREFLADGDYQSRVGYPETASVISQMTRLPAPPISRELSSLAPGDVAMVVRLRYRVQPQGKGAPTDASLNDWEIARLTRVL